MTMNVMKITVLPCNTCSKLSNDITLTGYIQYMKKVHGKGEKKQELMCPNISLRKYLYEGAIRTEQCRWVQWYQLSMHQLCFRCYCYITI